MLLDDSIELEYNDSSANAEALPINLDIDLSKIWIPSSVLPNRKKQINPNENKPFILYTLEKPDYSKTFSVYNDECPQYSESQTSSAVSSEISYHKIMNKNITFEIKQAQPLSQNRLEGNARLNIDPSEDGISPNHLEKSNNPDDSLRNFQETYNPMHGNAAHWEKETLDTNSVLDPSYKASLKDLTRRMAEILSEDEPLKENYHNEDGLITNQVRTESTLDSIPPSSKDSLEELYFSDEDENEFAIEYELENLESEYLEKKLPHSIYTENSYAQEQPTESFMNDLEHVKDNSDKSISRSFKEIEKTPSESQKIAVDNVLGLSEHGELNKMESVFHTKYSEQKLLDYEGELEDPTEKVVELPIAYKRPPLREQINKTKPQKERKRSKKPKINIPLTDLFQSDRFQVPEVDEFYENLVRQGKCKSLNPKTNINGFSTEPLQTNVENFPSLNFTDQSEISFWNSSQKFRESLSCKPQSNPPVEVNRIEEKAELQLELSNPLNTIIIDNIPLNVSKENIESFILGYGELRNLTIERRRKFQRAKLQMDSKCEIDWVIECLNDSQPFGSMDKEPIKCYRQTQDYGLIG